MNLDILQIVISALLAGSILLQHQGSGLGAGFGGDGNVYRTKRGLEKKLFASSIVLSILFLGTALMNVIS